MENEMNNQAPQDEMVNGVPHNLLDGYDGGTAPPAEFIQQMLEGAPPELMARIEQFAQQRQAAAGQAEAGAQPATAAAAE